MQAYSLTENQPEQQNLIAGTSRLVVCKAAGMSNSLICIYVRITVQRSTTEIVTKSTPTAVVVS
jgi:hypothetical protein